MTDSPPAEKAAAPGSARIAENVSNKYFPPSDETLKQLESGQSGKVDLVNCGVHEAHPTMKTASHIHSKGTRVRIYNGVEYDSDGRPSFDDNGNPILKFEGVATIVSRLDTDNYYKVRFAGEQKTYARFVMDDAVVESGAAA